MDDQSLCQGKRPVRRKSFSTKDTTYKRDSYINGGVEKGWGGWVVEEGQKSCKTQAPLKGSERYDIEADTYIEGRVEEGWALIQSLGMPE
mmetsp:Transcript_14318/g.23851  ORF Transcript_14318/g.23851 Transcript_14318/m.23851 type:complete len:90 (-) Transcript_14318:1491-1760(-)